MTIFRCSLVALLLSTVFAQAQTGNPEQVIVSLKGGILLLNSPWQGSKLRFNSDGALKKPAKVGGWMGSGLVYIESAKSDGKRIHIDGSRCLMVFDKEKRRIFGGKLNQPVTIEIDVQSSSETDAVSSLHAVFGKDDPNRLSNYFEPSFDTTRDWTEATKSLAGMPIGKLDGRPVYAVKAGQVEPPRIVYTPDPDYPTLEKSKGNPGKSVMSIVIDENGDPALLIPSRMPIMDFDFAAFQALTQWKFKPALKDGQPVAVAISVEINFRLY